MGCGMSAEERAAFERSRQIDKTLQREYERQTNEVKLLLLGELIAILNNSNKYWQDVVVSTGRCS